MFTKIVRISLVTTLLALTLPLQSMGHSAASSVSGDVALARLEKGNAFYASPRLRTIATRQRRASVAQTQRPFAVVVACSDSRVAPEIIYRQRLGDLFVVRCAGNLVDKYGMGSIQYAVEHLGSRLVVVLGHTRCGAVDAAIQGASGPKDLNAILEAIQPAVKRAKKTKGDLLENAVKDNARLVAEQIKRSKPGLSKLAGAPVKVIPAYYDLDTGRVTLLD